jgi:purine-binding chemotaxis protein CheW
MHSFVEGVMNIRGNVVPIVCLNKRVDLNVDMSSKKQSIIIISLMYEDEESDVGIVVSMVNKVFTKDEATLETSPTFGSKIRKDLIKNIAKVEEQFIPILDIDKILNLDDLSETLQDAV